MKMYDDADFYRGDLAGHSDVLTLADCVKMCVADASCEYFSYVTHKKKCWLKDGISIKHCQHIITNIIEIHTHFLFINNILQTIPGRHLTQRKEWLLVLDAALLIISI